MEILLSLFLHLETKQAKLSYRKAAEIPPTVLGDMMMMKVAGLLPYLVGAGGMVSVVRMRPSLQAIILTPTPTFITKTQIIPFTQQRTFLATRYGLFLLSLLIALLRRGKITLACITLPIEASLMALKSEFPGTLFPTVCL